MKKNLLFFIPLLATSSLFLGGCQSSKAKIRITYGSPVYEEMVELTYSDFTQKMTNGENMIVATYDSEQSATCGCWIYFQPILNRYVNDHDTVIYKMDRLTVVKDTYGIILPSGSDPTFFITNKGEIVHQYVYNTTSANAELFHSYDKFADNLASLTKEPQIMLIDEEYLNKAIFEENRSDFIIYHGRSGCPDCGYCTPNVLEPYARDNDLKNKIYMIDIEYLRGTDGYQPYKNKYQLSAYDFDEDGNKIEINPTYGYQQGVVPTFQYWKNGVLSDACVYFNDSYEKKNDKWTITDSYYTNKRVANLKYTSTVLLGNIIPDEEIQEIKYGEKSYYIWKQDEQAKIHNKLLTSFLDYYAK